jgi:hypothetical protein
MIRIANGLAQTSLRPPPPSSLVAPSPPDTPSSITTPLSAGSFSAGSGRFSSSAAGNGQGGMGQLRAMMERLCMVLWPRFKTLLDVQVLLKGCIVTHTLVSQGVKAKRQPCACRYNWVQISSDVHGCRWNLFVPPMHRRSWRQAAKSFLIM